MQKSGKVVHYESHPDLHAFKEKTLAYDEWAATANGKRLLPGNRVLDEAIKEFDAAYQQHDHPKLVQSAAHIADGCRVVLELAMDTTQK